VILTTYDAWDDPPSGDFRPVLSKDSPTKIRQVLREKLAGWRFISQQHIFSTSKKTLAKPFSHVLDLGPPPRMLAPHHQDDMKHFLGSGIPN